MRVGIAIRLAVRQWAARPLRPILCSLAIAAAVALIVCVGAAFDSLAYTMQTGIGQMLGVAEIHVRPAQKETDARLSQAMLTHLRDRPDVELANGRMQAHAGIGPVATRRWFDTMGVETKMEEVLRPKTYLAGHALTGAADEIVVDSGVNDLLHLKVGDTLPMTFDGETTREVKLVGIVKSPSIELLSRPTIYMPVETLAKGIGNETAYNVIDLKLRESAKVDDYDAYAKQLGKELGPGVQVSPGTNSKAKLAAETRSIQIILSLLSTVAAICAALIIGTTLSVGVQERVRQFGQLRCIGASRKQLMVFLAGDALVMLAIGEAMGVLLGMALSLGLVWYFPQYFLAYRVSASSVMIALMSGAFATMLGAVIPMWQVARVSPMAAVTAVSKMASGRRVWWAAAVGVLCLVAQGLLWVCLPPSEIRFHVYMFVGIPLILLGWPLLGPACLVSLERFGATVIGGALRVRPTLLRNAWSRTPWRAGAMIGGLMIGVTLFTAVRARGESLLSSWVSPARLPDLLLFSTADAVLPSLFGNNAVAPIERRAEQLKKEYPAVSDVAAISTFGAHLKSKIFKVGDIFGEAYTNFVAVEPRSFSRLIEMEYVQGNPEQAIKELEQGNHIFVTKEFYNVRHLGVGDKITLISAEGKPVDFTISAVVTSTGMELVKNYFDMRAVFQDNAISSILGSLDDAHKYFKSNVANIMLVNLKPGEGTVDKVNTMKENLAKSGYQSVSSVELKAKLIQIVGRVVDSLSIIAFGALCVASLGVVNMVIASVHARRYEFGVLRAIGAGRSQLVRLVLAEATLIGLVAGVLGACSGLELAYMATLVDRLLIGFQTNFLSVDTGTMLRSVMWYVVSAVGLTVLLAWAASVLPAVRGARTAQRTLLASGRI